MNNADRIRISEYLHSLERDGDELLCSMRSYASLHDVPIIRIETESFIRTMLKIIRPEHILEIGAAIGYSSICMAKACDADIITVENYDKRISAARANIAKAGLEGRIKLVERDAGELLKDLYAEGRSFDFIFLDAAKGQYPVWLPDIMKLMHPGSVLLADNVLQECTVTESRYTVPRRERTTHERMREFLFLIKHNERIESSVLNVGDGVSVSVML